MIWKIDQIQIFFLDKFSESFEYFFTSIYDTICLFNLCKYIILYTFFLNSLF